MLKCYMGNTLISCLYLQLSSPTIPCHSLNFLFTHSVEISLKYSQPLNSRDLPISFQKKKWNRMLSVSSDYDCFNICIPSCTSFFILKWRGICSLIYDTFFVYGPCFHVSGTFLSFLGCFFPSSFPIPSPSVLSLYFHLLRLALK